MNPELEALLKAWDACLQAEEGQEADRFLERYDAQIEKTCSETKVSKEILDRAVQRAYQRWQWPTTQSSPRIAKDQP